METKQTAVEWLESEMHELDYDRIFSSFEEYDTEREKLWEQAKQMEKEQIEESFNSSSYFIDGKEYYDDTYGN
jgi:hypothetical protein